MTANVKFIEPHTYLLDGQPLFSVTQVLREAGVSCAFNRDPIAQARGKRIHKACRFLDENDLDWNTVAIYDRPYLNAWQEFKRSVSLKIELIEHLVYSKAYNYAGTLDRKGKMRIGGRQRRVIIDLKTGQIDPATRFQLVAYGYALSPRRLFERVAVGLKPDGKFSMRIYPSTEYKHDLDTFLSALRLQQRSNRYERQGIE